MPFFSMPVLRPVAIPTRDQSWFKALKMWWCTQRQWEVMEDWYYTLSDGRTVVVPKGFTFDGASVPRPLRWLISPVGVFLIPSLLHDFGYTYDYQWLSVNGRFVKVQLNLSKDRRWVWDRQFYEVSIEVNGMKWLSKAAYATLRFGGWLAWRNSRKAKQPGDSLPGQ